MSGKNPVFVEAGRRGSAKRWPLERRVSVRIDELSPDQRRLVVALVEAAKAAPALHELSHPTKQDATADHGDAPGEVRDAARTPTS